MSDALPHLHVENAVRRATTIGLSSTWINGVWVLPDAVVLWVIATDDDPDDDDEGLDGTSTSRRCCERRHCAYAFAE